MAALCSEMRRNRYIDRMAAISALANFAHESDESAIDGLSNYLLHAKRVVEKDGTPPIMAALEALKRIAAAHQGKIEEARLGVLVALASKTAATGGKDYIHKLLALAKEHAGPLQNVLAELVKGFQNHNASMREACKSIFGKICQPGDEAALRILMEMIQGDVYSWSRCGAIQMLPKVVTTPRSEVSKCLLGLCNEADVAIRSAALCAMRRGLLEASQRCGGKGLSMGCSSPRWHGLSFLLGKIANRLAFTQTACKFWIVEISVSSNGRASLDFGPVDVQDCVHKSLNHWFDRHT